MILCGVVLYCTALSCTVYNRVLRCCSGNLIKDLERRYDVALSDISFLKMDTTVRATRISQLEEEITELKRQYAQALAKIEGLQTQVCRLREVFNHLITSTHILTALVTLFPRSDC